MPDSGVPSGQSNLDARSVCVVVEHYFGAERPWRTMVFLGGETVGQFETLSREGGWGDAVKTLADYGVTVDG